jgi:hypothetical protein
MKIYSLIHYTVKYPSGLVRPLCKRTFRSGLINLVISVNPKCVCTEKSLLDKSHYIIPTKNNQLMVFTNRQQIHNPRLNIVANIPNFYML